MTLALVLILPIAGLVIVAIALREAIRGNYKPLIFCLLIMAPFLWLAATGGR